MKSPQRKAVGILLLALAMGHEAIALDMVGPKKGERCIQGIATLGGAGTAEPGDNVVVEIMSGGIVQARGVVRANPRGQWAINLKRPPAGWFLGEATITARVGKRQVSRTITIIPD